MEHRIGSVHDVRRGGCRMVEVVEVVGEIVLHT